MVIFFAGVHWTSRPPEPRSVERSNGWWLPSSPAPRRLRKRTKGGWGSLTWLPSRMAGSPYRLNGISQGCLQPRTKIPDCQIIQWAVAQLRGRFLPFPILFQIYPRKPSLQLMLITRSSSSSKILLQTRERGLGGD